MSESEILQIRLPNIAEKQNVVVCNDNTKVKWDHSWAPEKEVNITLEDSTLSKLPESNCDEPNNCNWFEKKEIPTSVQGLFNLATQKTCKQVVKIKLLEDVLKNKNWNPVAIDWGLIDSNATELEKPKVAALDDNTGSSTKHCWYVQLDNVEKNIGVAYMMLDNGKVNSAWVDDRLCEESRFALLTGMVNKGTDSHTKDLEFNFEKSGTNSQHDWMFSRLHKMVIPKTVEEETETNKGRTFKVHPSKELTDPNSDISKTLGKLGLSLQNNVLDLTHRSPASFVMPDMFQQLLQSVTTPMTLQINSDLKDMLNTMFNDNDNVTVTVVQTLPFGSKTAASMSAPCGSCQCQSKNQFASAPGALAAPSHASRGTAVCATCKDCIDTIPPCKLFGGHSSCGPSVLMPSARKPTDHQCVDKLYIVDNDAITEGAKDAFYHCLANLLSQQPGDNVKEIKESISNNPDKWIILAECGDCQGAETTKQHKEWCEKKNEDSKNCSCGADFKQFPSVVAFSAFSESSEKTKHWDLDYFFVRPTSSTGQAFASTRNPENYYDKWKEILWRLTVSLALRKPYSKPESTSKEDNNSSSDQKEEQEPKSLYIYIPKAVESTWAPFLNKRCAHKFTKDVNNKKSSIVTVESDDLQAYKLSLDLHPSSHHTLERRRVPESITTAPLDKHLLGEPNCHAIQDNSMTDILNKATREWNDKYRFCETCHEQDTECSPCNDMGNKKNPVQQWALYPRSSACDPVDPNADPWIQMHYYNDDQFKDTSYYTVNPYNCLGLQEHMLINPVRGTKRFQDPQRHALNLMNLGPRSCIPLDPCYLTF
jgi:hypothetical protein